MDEVIDLTALSPSPPHRGRSRLSSAPPPLFSPGPSTRRAASGSDGTAATTTAGPSHLVPPRRRARLVTASEDDDDSDYRYHEVEDDDDDDDDTVEMGNSASGVGAASTRAEAGTTVGSGTAATHVTRARQRLGGNEDEPIDMSLSDDDEDEEPPRRPFSGLPLRRRPSFPIDIPRRRTRAVDNQDDFNQTMNGMSPLSIRHDRHRPVIGAGLLSPTISCTPDTLPDRLPISLPLSLSSPLPTADLDNTLQRRQAQLRRLREHRETERAEREREEIFSPPPPVVPRPHIGLGGAVLRAGGRDVVFHGNGSVTRGVAPRPRGPDLDDGEDEAEPVDRVEAWLGDLGGSGDDDEHPHLRRFMARRRHFGDPMADLRRPAAPAPSPARGAPNQPFGQPPGPVRTRFPRPVPVRAGGRPGTPHAPPAIFGEDEEDAPADPAPAGRGRYGGLGRAGLLLGLDFEFPTFDPTFRLREMIQAGTFGLNPFFYPAPGGAGRRGEDDVANILASVELPPIPPAHQGFARTFDMDELEKAVPIELDDSDDEARSRTKKTGAGIKGKAKPKKQQPCLVCAMCLGPLLVGSAQKSDEDRVYALQCGHMIDGRCLASLSVPSPDEARLNAHPPTQYDLELSGSAGEGDSGEGDGGDGEWREEDEKHGRSVTKKLRTRSGAAVPVVHRHQPPRGKKGGAGKGGRRALPREYEWKCPVEWCKEVHVSVQSAASEDWVQREGDGAIQVYV